MRITSEPDGATNDVQRVRDALGAFNVQATGAKEYWPIRVFLRDDSGTLQGGLVGDIWGGWFHVELLWLARRRGLRVAEVGVEWNHSPDSRVHLLTDSARMALDILRMRLLHWARRRRP